MTATPTSPMRLAVEAWAPEYGTAIGADQLPPAESDVDPDVEVPAGDWAPRTPSTGVSPGSVLFVDGVRRVDARVWIIDDDGLARAGLAASYAAGVVRCASAGRSPRTAVVERCEVRRGLFSAAPSLSAVTTRYGTYRPCVVAGDGVDALSLGLQQRMGELEGLVVAEAADADLVVVDGPLNRAPSLSCAVGYVKTHQRRYLPAELAAVVAALEAGQRTPLFITTAAWSRYSWYARLPAGVPPDPVAHPWAGVVRGEVSGDLAAAEAARLADLATATLPAYASAAYKDPRAPQNLVPVGELERALRRHLGDPALLYRSFRCGWPRASPPEGVAFRAARRALSAHPAGRVCHTRRSGLHVGDDLAGWRVCAPVHHGLLPRVFAKAGLTPFPPPSERFRFLSERTAWLRPAKLV